MLAPKARASVDYFLNVSVKFIQLRVKYLLSDVLPVEIRNAFLFKLVSTNQDRSATLPVRHFG